jgi:hypothetical protein
MTPEVSRARARLAARVTAIALFGLALVLGVASPATEFVLCGNVPGTVRVYRRLRGWGTASTGAWTGGT